MESERLRELRMKLKSRHGQNYTITDEIDFIANLGRGVWGALSDRSSTRYILLNNYLKCSKFRIFPSNIDRNKIIEFILSEVSKCKERECNNDKFLGKERGCSNCTV